MNREDKPFVLQFIASSHGEGTSATVVGFADAAAAHWGGRVLLVDCSSTASGERLGAGSPSLLEAFSNKGALHHAMHPAPGRPGVVLARLIAPEGVLSRVDLSDLGRLFTEAKQGFPFIVLDCQPVAESPESLALARCSDGTVLVVGAGSSSRSMIVQTRNDIERFGGQVIGCVLNRAKNYMPSWLQRWF
ncbi:CpsD/CapB family tyrosine-protein kinase [Methylocapsa palsarum]|nr:CpsD/CapB family tyrosine-protein kinase [Methylocapsa palsarum]